MPNVVILVGPNGAGKTSAASVLLRDELRVSEFVNADVIARGLSGFTPAAVAIEAGRMMLRRLEELAAAGVDFAFETTLSGGAFLGSSLVGGLPDIRCTSSTCGCRLLISRSIGCMSGTRMAGIRFPMR